VNTTEIQLLVALRSEVPAPDEAAAARAYAVVMEAAEPESRLTAFRMSRPRLLVAVAIAALALAGGASALAFHYFASSPGFSAGFSAFDRLPQASWPDSLPRVALERSAAYVGVSPDRFLQRLRLVRTGLTLGPGRTKGAGELYAYVGDHGETACMFLTGQSGTCFDATRAQQVQGVLPLISPGYPGQIPALTAIVADNVTAVELDVSERVMPLRIINNSVYADLGALQATDRLNLHVTYDDGGTAVVSLPNPVG
jgi:hypothetical protein